MPITTSDVLAHLRSLPDNSYDALLSDPPYGISFMAKKWDYDVPKAEVWREAYRVLKPGAPILVFGGTRTFHRLVCAIENGGFEIRDTLAWMTGQGFPKSLNFGCKCGRKEISQYNVRSSQTSRGYGTTCEACGKLIGWDGYGTALKPAFEPICLARKPLYGTVTNNVLSYGVGGINIDACRIGTDQVTINTFDNGAKPFGNASGEAYTSRTSTGRWPANVILDEEAGAALDEQTGNRPSATNKKPTIGGKRTSQQVLGESSGSVQNVALYAGETGGVSRFFYCAKVSTKERNAGCEELQLLSAGEVTNRKDGSDGLNSPRVGAGRTGGGKNPHPTLKPIALTQYLATLILPPKRDGDRRLLIPYSGTGSEMIGAYKAGWEHVDGIELDETYVDIATKRLLHWCNE